LALNPAFASFHVTAFSSGNSFQTLLPFVFYFFILQHSNTMKFVQVPSFAQPLKIKYRL